MIGNLYADFINSQDNILADFNEQPISYEVAKNNFVNVWLYYSSLSYTLSTETPSMDIVSLLANIGGTIGMIYLFFLYLWHDV